MIKCPNCSADLEYKVEDELVYCEYCGSKFNPKELDVKVDVSEEQDDSNSYEGKSYTCSQCGATLLTFDETAITFCSYCGSQAMIESKMVRTNNPDYIIPFKKTKEECIDNYKKTLKKSFFAPNYMKSDIVVSKFRGIYIPYGIYNLQESGVFYNKGSKRSHRSGDYVYYDDYTIDTDSETSYEGLSFDLLSKFYDKYSMSIPFDYKECEPFNPNYLAGFYADTKDVDDKTYDEVAKNIAKEDASSYLRGMKEYKKYGCDDPKMPIAVNERKLGMFPIYFLAIRDKKQEHVNYAVINGQNGKVAASLPLDFKKYILVALIISILIYLLINYSNLLFLPKHIVVFSMIVSFISFLISNTQLKKIDVNRKHLDDLGYIVTNNIDSFIKDSPIKKDTKAANKTKIIMLSVLSILTLLMIPLCFNKEFMMNNSSFPIFLIVLFGMIIIIILYSMIREFLLDRLSIGVSSKEISPFRKRLLSGLYKQIIAIIGGGIVLYLNPVDDFYYYGVAIISLFIIIVSFYDLVKEHNELVSNKLPQLEKRGGDENE